MIACFIRNALWETIPNSKDFIGRGFSPYNVAKTKGELKYILLYREPTYKKLMKRRTKTRGQRFQRRHGRLNWLQNTQR